MSLRFLANIFHTPKGRAQMADAERAKSLIEFCTRSFSSCNHKIVFHAGLVLFNYLLCFEKEGKKHLQSVLEQAFTALNEVLWKANEEANKDMLIASLMCMCRLMYKNHEMTVWVEQSLKESFKSTISGLKERTAAQPVEVSQAIADVLSMVKLDE